jgi:hypothetical protein
VTVGAVQRAGNLQNVLIGLCASVREPSTSTVAKQSEHADRELNHACSSRLRDGSKPPQLHAHEREPEQDFQVHDANDLDAESTEVRSRRGNLARTTGPNTSRANGLTANARPVSVCTLRTADRRKAVSN